MFCPRCGAQNEPGDKTCLRCGTELPQPQAGSIGEGPRPTRNLQEDASTNEVNENLPTQKYPPGYSPQAPDYDRPQSKPGYGEQPGDRGYGNTPPGYGGPGSYRIGPSYQNAPSYGAP